MGYTHYWKAKKSNATKFKAFSNTCKKLYENLPEFSKNAGGYYENDKIEIANAIGKGNPEFNDTHIAFNGKGDELAHESFIIDNNNYDFNFCKTARKPYDLLVVACLIAAYEILDYRFSSDGINEKCCDDLQPAIDFYNEVIKPNPQITQEIIIKQSKY